MHLLQQAANSVFMKLIKLSSFSTPGSQNGVMIAYVLYSQGGMYIFNLMDYQTAGLSLLFISLMEVIAVGWIYGRMYN